MAVSIKFVNGFGVDEQNRMQPCRESRRVHFHLLLVRVVSRNSCECGEWDIAYGFFGKELKRFDVDGGRGRRFLGGL